MPPRYGDSAPPYLNVRDLFTVLSFKYLMINWGGGGSNDHTWSQRGEGGGSPEGWNMITRYLNSPLIKTKYSRTPSYKVQSTTPYPTCFVNIFNCIITISHYKESCNRIKSNQIQCYIDLRIFTFLYTNSWSEINQPIKTISQRITR